MISHLPYVNKLTYLLQSKLQCELTEDMLNDINYAFYDYGTKCVEVVVKEKEDWKKDALNR